jgi:hypothetical protein
MASLTLVSCLHPIQPRKNANFQITPFLCAGVLALLTGTCFCEISSYPYTEASFAKSPGHGSVIYVPVCTPDCLKSSSHHHHSHFTPSCPEKVKMSPWRDQGSRLLLFSGAHREFAAAGARPDLPSASEPGPALPAAVPASIAGLRREPPGWRSGPRLSPPR